MQKTAWFSYFAAHEDTRRFRFALVETIVLLSAMVLLDRVFGDGTRFMSMGLHPFWIVVLVVTLQYGPNEALAAALLASIFLLAGNLPEQNITETMYAYMMRVAFLPFLWMTTALVLGGIRSRQLREKRALQERLGSAEAAANTLAQSYLQMKQQKERLELRVAEERRGVLGAYKMVQLMEKLDPSDALSATAELVRGALSPAKFSLYRWADGGLALEASHGWEKTDAYAPQFTTSAPLVHAIAQKKQLHVLREEDEPLLASEGMLAGAIRDAETGRIFGMLKIEDIGFMEMGIRTQEIFQMVCEWAGRIYARAEKEKYATRKMAPLPDTLTQLHVPAMLYMQRDAQRVA